MSSDAKPQMEESTSHESMWQRYADTLTKCVWCEKPYFNCDSLCCCAECDGAYRNYCRQTAAKEQSVTSTEDEEYCYNCKGVLHNHKYGVFCSQECEDDDYEKFVISISPSTCLHCYSEVKKGQVYCSDYCAEAEFRKDEEEEDSSYEDNHCPNCFQYNGLLTHPPLPYCCEMCAWEAKKEAKKKAKAMLKRVV